MDKIKLLWNKICDTFKELKFSEMPKKVFKYKISSDLIRKANSALMRKGISDNVRKTYNGNIQVEYRTKNGLVTKSFSNSDIKEAYEKALNTYAERI